MQIAVEAPASCGRTGVCDRFLINPKISITSSSGEGKDARQAKASLKANVLYSARLLVERITQEAAKRLRSELH